MAAQDLTTADSFTILAKARLRTATDKANSDLDLDSEVYLDALADALETLNADKPYVKMLEITGDASAKAFTLTGWAEGFSVIAPEEGVEDRGTVAGGKYPPDFMGRTEWWKYVTVSGTTKTHEIRFRTAPATNQIIWVKFKVPHTINGLLSASLTTVFETDRRALNWLQSANVARVIQAERAKLGDSQAGEDSLDLGDKSTTWGDVATAWEKKYSEHVTPTDAQIPGAGMRAHWEPRNPFTGDRFLTH